MAQRNIKSNDETYRSNGKRFYFKLTVPVRYVFLRQVIGSIDGSGRVTLVDDTAAPGTPTPVDLDLEKVLGSMPDKTFK